jgi:hypothetical protein
MPSPSLLKDINKYHPNAQAHIRKSYEGIAAAANRMGVDPYQFMQSQEGLREKEEKQKLEAMDPNKSKFMSPEEKNRRLNAFSNRRYLQFGIGAVPGEHGIPIELAFAEK